MKCFVWFLGELKAWINPNTAIERSRRTKRAPLDIAKLPSCVCLYCVSFLSAVECTKARLVNSSWRILTKDNALWQDLCDIAGKPSLTQEDLDRGVESCEEQYKLNPSVPQDFKSIQGALNYLRGKSGRTVFVSGGVYSEAIELEYTEVTIKAAKGKVIFQRSFSETDIPIIRIQSGTIKLIDIQIVHGCNGNDLK